MARQQLIHLHTSGTTATSSVLLTTNPLALGEIAVQHNENDAKIYIRLSSASNGEAVAKLATFITDSAVDAKISAAQQSINADISELSDKIGTGFTSVNTVAKAIADEASARQSADSSLQDAIDELEEGLSAETSAREAVASNLASEVTRAQGAESGLSTRIGTAENDIDAIEDKLDGIDSTVKTYVDDAVAGAVSSVYKVKGSVATYDDLPSSDLVEGDVYNVVAAAVVDSKPYPAGTNWVWVAEGNSGHWDALGGVVDLEPYMQKSAFNTWSASNATTLTTMQGDIDDLDDAITAETSARESADSALNVRLTAVENSIGSGSTTQRLNALEAAITAETAARTAETSSLSSSVSSLQSDLSDEVDRATGAESSLNDAITAETSARQSADSSLNDAITAETSAREAQDSALNNAITAETEARETLATTVGTHTTDIQNINDEIGSGFSAQNTIASKIAALEGTSGSAVQTVSVANTATNGITATKSGTTVTLNFDEMVIDCGTYGD